MNIGGVLNIKGDKTNCKTLILQKKLRFLTIRITFKHPEVNILSSNSINIPLKAN